MFFEVFLFDFYIYYNIYIYQFLIITNMLYFIGIFGIIFNNRNFLITMLFIEVMYVSIFLYLIVASFYLNSPIGQIYALSILLVVACESAVGLGILILLYQKNKTINWTFYQQLK
jgi:NADH-quinone oxidoreductase subunit K